MTKTILTIADYYLPGYKGGGPIRTIANTVDWLGDAFNFNIITRDRDLGNHQAYPNIIYNNWMPVGGANVRYLAPMEQNPRILRTILRQLDYDAIYLNSFFSAICVKTMIAYKYGRHPQKPVLIAPRNEFYPAALNIKRTKKRLYLQMVKFIGTYNAIFWQASSDYEADRIKIIFPKATTFVAPNLAAKHLPPQVAPAPKNNSGPLRIIFLSRISRKKNLDYALRILSQVKKSVIFDIYGPKEEPVYWAECETIIRSLPKHITATYKGELTPEQVIPTFARYHLFFFPTHGENYGHVIWESLYAGCPVLLSDQTPWRNLENKGIGWDVPLDNTDQFIQIITTTATTDENRHHQYAKTAQNYAKQIAHDDAVVEANRQMFTTILNTQG